jgi:hypothetical protein
MKHFFLLILIFVSACSTPEPKEPTRSESFFQTWSEDFYVENKEFQAQYKTYLTSVEEFFKTNQQPQKFESYLSSTNNFFQLMAHSEFNTQSLYRRIKGPRVAMNTKMYEDFKNRNLSQQYEKLNRERENRLKGDLGFELFEKLKAHYTQLGYPTQTLPRFPL